MESRIDRPATSSAGAGPRAPGFTLIELMVVIAVLSLLTLSATLGVNRPRRAESEDWARFARIHALLREQAVMGQEVLGLRLTPDGYLRLRRDRSGWLGDGPDATWARPVQVMEPFGADSIVAFLPSGQSTPVRLSFAPGATGSGLETQCVSDGWGPVTCANP